MKLIALAEAAEPGAFPAAKGTLPSATTAAHLGAAGRRAMDVLCASLPVGTRSGAPNIRAMEITGELEPAS